MGARRGTALSRPRLRRSGLALAALVLLACSEDPSSGEAGRENGHDAAAADARVAAEPPDAAMDLTIDAHVPTGDGAVAADRGPDAAAPDPGAVASDAGLAPDAAVEDPPRGRVPLVDQKAWVDVAEKDDPWSDRPDDATCEPEGYGYEVFGDEDSYFVNTAKCAYKTASQESLTDVRAGDEIAARLWYFELLGPDGAQAHLALRIGERDVLDEVIPLPAPGTLLRKRVVVDEPIPAGTPVLLHVHNHGANEYYMLELSTGPEGL